LPNALSIVLDDSRLLREVCGIHDNNLRVMEELLGSRVLSRGNELLVETDDEQTKRLFSRLIDGLSRHVHAGQIPGSDLVRAEYRSIASGSGNGNTLHDRHIMLPAGTKVFPRSAKQADYIDIMNRHDLVFSIGPAGTGKTYLAVAHALRAVLERKKKKLVLTRPVVEAGESLGFLPGDLEQKISPYLRPLYDAMDAFIPIETISRLESNRVIEIAPLAYMRGRSLRDCYIILDEAQNTTQEQMKMFLTRLGEGSNAVVTGDITQVDLPKKSQSGLIHAVDLLSDIEEIAVVRFDSSDVVRHPLVRKIVCAYEAAST
jgi:phosphate starvation-inducible protein PhoH and related proteins